MKNIRIRLKPDGQVLDEVKDIFDTTQVRLESFSNVPPSELEFSGISDDKRRQVIASLTEDEIRQLASTLDPEEEVVETNLSIIEFEGNIIRNREPISFVPSLTVNNQAVKFDSVRWLLDDEEISNEKVLVITANMIDRNSYKILTCIVEFNGTDAKASTKVYNISVFDEVGSLDETVDIFDDSNDNDTTETDEDNNADQTNGGASGSGGNVINGDGNDDPTLIIQ